MFQDESQGFVDLYGLDHVVVVENQDEVLPECSDIVDQRGQHGFDRRWLRSLAHRLDRLPDAGLNRLQRSNTVGQESDQVVFPPIQGDPGNR